MAVNLQDVRPSIYVRELEAQKAGYQARAKALALGLLDIAEKQPDLHGFVVSLIEKGDLDYREAYQREKAIVL